jgi:hypothetical protein
MANPKTFKTSKERTKSAQWPGWKFEIVQESSDSVESLWSRLDRSLRPMIEAAHNVLGDVYATTAKAVLERKEAFEDLRAEQKARQRTAPRDAKGTGSAHKIRLAETGAGPKNGLASDSKTHA